MPRTLEEIDAALAALEAAESGGKVLADKHEDIDIPGRVVAHGLNEARLDLLEADKRSLTADHTEIGPGYIATPTDEDMTNIQRIISNQLRVASIEDSLSGFNDDITTNTTDITDINTNLPSLSSRISALEAYINPSTFRQNEVLSNLTISDSYNTSSETVHRVDWPYGAGRYIFEVQYGTYPAMIYFELEITSDPLSYADTPSFTAYTNNTAWVRLMHARIEFHQTKYSGEPTFYGIYRVI